MKARASRVAPTCSSRSSPPSRRAPASAWFCRARSRKHTAAPSRWITALVPPVVSLNCDCRSELLLLELAANLAAGVRNSVDVHVQLAGIEEFHERIARDAAIGRSAAD